MLQHMRTGITRPYCVRYSWQKLPPSVAAAAAAAHHKAAAAVRVVRAAPIASSTSQQQQQNPSSNMASNKTPPTTAGTGAVFPEQYEEQLADKVAKVKDWFAGHTIPEIEVHRSSTANFRMRAEFRCVKHLLCTSTPALACRQLPFVAAATLVIA